MVAERTQGRVRAGFEGITGIGTRYARMLEAAGVASVEELAEQDSLELSDVLLGVNLLRGMVLVVPSEKRVAGWIEQARARSGQDSRPH